jgi:dihydrofolate reductase
MDEPEPVMQEYAEIWRAARKIVYSRTLAEPRSARTEIRAEFDPSGLPDGKASIGGADLAASAFAAGVVDEIHLYVVPVIVGGGKRALPADVRMDVRLVGTRTFDGGAVHLEYAR